MNLLCARASPSMVQLALLLILRPSQLNGFLYHRQRGTQSAMPAKSRSADIFAHMGVAAVADVSKRLPPILEVRREDCSVLSSKSI